MVTVKKLLFAIPFLAFFYLSFYFSLPFLKSTDYLFSLNISALLSLIYLTVAVFLASISFVVFATLADDWAYVAPVAFLGCLVLIVIPIPNILIYIVLGLALLLLVFWSLSSKLKTYLTFQPGLILGHTVSNLAKFLALLLALAYFLTIGPMIKQNGFNIPDSILKLTMGFTSPQVQDQIQISPSNLPTLSQSQLNLLKQNPQLLQQYGVDPKLIDQVQNLENSPSTSPSSPTVNSLIKAQFQEMIKPYLAYLPGILAAMFFVTLYSLLGLILITSGPLLSLIFYILEETGYVHFQTETREVKKLVV